MPGTGHSHRYKGSISNRNTKSSFQVLAPWNAKKNGEKNQVAVSTGGNNLNFQLMGAKMMSNYNDASNAWVLDCSLVVLGNKIIDGSSVITGNVEIDGTLDVTGLATFEDVDICGNLNANTGTFNGILTNVEDTSGVGFGGIVTEYLTVNKKAFINAGDIVSLIDVSDNLLSLGNNTPGNNEQMRGIITTNGLDNYGFFGFDPSGLQGPSQPDSSGSFVFLIDASSNPVATRNVTQGIAGRGVFGAIDISGGARYGGIANGVSGQTNSAMVLVGRTIIATDSGASAKLDISGGINVDGDIGGNGVNFAINYTAVDINGGTTTLDASTALKYRISGYNHRYRQF